METGNQIGEEELVQLNRMWQRGLKNETTISKLEKKLKVKQKGAEVVHGEVWQKLDAVESKLERYDNMTEQNRQNCLFGSNQKRLFNKLKQTQTESVVPDAEESGCFCSDIWDQLVTQWENRLVGESGEWIGRADSTRWDILKFKK